MTARFSSDLAGGAALLITGIAVAVYSAANYQVGSITRMGPGMFPLALGVILAGLGLLIAIGGLVRMKPAEESFSLKGMIFVLASVAVFALVAPVFGVLPGVVATTLVSAFADGRLSPLRCLALASALVVLCWLTFDVMLDISFPMARWPF